MCQSTKISSSKLREPPPNVPAVAIRHDHPLLFVLPLLPRLLVPVQKLIHAMGSAHFILFVLSSPPVYLRGQGHPF